MTPSAVSPLAPVLELQDVAVPSMTDPSVTVAEHIDWSVGAGEFWVVAGPQRSGKSDLLMLLAGLMAPASGSHHLFGGVMPGFGEERLAERLRLGFVFEEGQLFGRMTVAENVALPLRYHREPAREALEHRVRAVLELTELTAFANSTPAHLARNWRKRAGLARALILQPEVLLLDDPLAGLEARHGAWWLQFLAAASRGADWLDGRPLTIVASASDLRPWRARSPRIACLIERQLRVFRDWQELDQSGETRVRELLNAELPVIDPRDGI